ncbi:hypothetical protein OS493_035626 [Desmophyllum pertusum]|uniref:Uncharacterized protein n=1 Tax=Desmophyllum pertusum TaxID=174260 RepID=A0A9X0D2E6_9CNID|nr:hypothetical protein OS493_035626 [Desmophyllum pertusum]
MPSSSLLSSFSTQLTQNTEETDIGNILWLIIATASVEKSNRNITDANRNLINRSDTLGLPFVPLCGGRSYGLDNLIQRWRYSLRLSLKEILSLVDLTAEFEWKRKLWFEIGKAQVETTLRNCSNDCLLPFFKSCVKEEFEKHILEVFGSSCIQFNLPRRGCADSGVHC